MGEGSQAKLMREEEPRRGSFGDRLRRERETRGISLDDVSISTKIGMRMLRALEDEKFDQLPGGIFNKGFVRAYARHLGIDVEQAVADYLEAAGETTPSQPLEPLLESPPIAPKPDIEDQASQIPWGLLAILLLVAALGLYLWSYRARHVNTGPRATPDSAQAQPQTPPQSQTAPPAPNPEAPNPTPPPELAPKGPAANSVSSQVDLAAQRSKGSAGTGVGGSVGSTTANTTFVQDANSANIPAKPVSPATPANFVVLIEADENSWVSITADGKTILEGTLIAPAVKAVRAQKQIVVKAGNVGGLSFSFNGKKLAPQGDPGTVKILTFTASGLEELTPKPPG